MPTEPFVLKFRKKAVVIEAVQWDGTTPTGDRLRAWSDHRVRHHDGAGCFIETLEGTMEARPGDWIIKGVKGEFYPCKPDIFTATYEEATAALQAQQPDPIRELRAYARGLEDAQQPGAQAVGYVSPRVIEHLRNGGHSCTTITTHRAMLDDVALYAQPPSIPEPSGEDAIAAGRAFWAAYKSGPERRVGKTAKGIFAAITTDRARLRERIGGGK